MIFTHIWTGQTMAGSSSERVGGSMDSRLLCFIVCGERYVANQWLYTTSYLDSPGLAHHMSCEDEKGYSGAMAVSNLSGEPRLKGTT